MAPLNSLPSPSGRAQSCQQHTRSTQQHSLALCILREFWVTVQNLGTKQSRVQLSPWKSSHMQEAECSHASMSQNQGTEQNRSLQTRFIQNAALISQSVNQNRSHETQRSLSIRLNYPLSYRICASTAKKDKTQPSLPTKPIPYNL